MLQELRPKGKRSINEFNKRFKTYNDYLKSDEWKSLKKIYFINIKKICIGCRSKKTIQLHHKSYKRLGGLNEVKDLISVCKKCHNEIHTIQKKNGLPLARATTMVLGSMKAVRKKQKGKQKIVKADKRLINLRIKREKEGKILLIRDLVKKGINMDFNKYPYAIIKNIHSKYVA